jgi:hypothetical protein
MIKRRDGESMSELANISISKCEIEFLPGTKSYHGKPMADRKAATNQNGKLTTFRVTSSDELNLIVGLIEWENAEPEVIPIDKVAGLQKHEDLARRGRMSVQLTSDDKWLIVLSVLKYSPLKEYFTLHGGNLEDIDTFVGESFKDILIESGALRFGTRAEIDGETSRSANQLAVVIEPGDIQTVALAYTVTRALAVINDYGLDA